MVVMLNGTEAALSLIVSSNLRCSHLKRRVEILAIQKRLMLLVHAEFLSAGSGRRW